PRSPLARPSGRALPAALAGRALARWLVGGARGGPPWWRWGPRCAWSSPPGWGGTKPPPARGPPPVPRAEQPNAPAPPRPAPRTPRLQRDPHSRSGGLTRRKGYLLGTLHPTPEQEPAWETVVQRCCLLYVACSTTWH